MVSNPFGGGLTVQVDSDVSGFQAGIAGAMSQLGNFRKEIGLVGGAIATMSAVGIQKAVKEFGNFDEAMTESLAIMGDVGDEMETQLEQKAFDVAEATTFSADEVAEAYFFMASAGIPAADMLNEVGGMAEFAQAGNFDLATATDILTDALSAMGLEMDDAAKLQDQLVKANQESNATVEEFGEALLTKGATAMREFNIPMEEGISMLMAFADQGIKGSEAGTALDRVIRRLPQRAVENAEAFEDLGVSIFDAEGNMRPLTEIIPELGDAFGDMSDEQRTAELRSLGFQQRTASSISTLIGGQDALGGYEESLKDAGGATQEVADKQLDTLNKELDLLRSRIQNAAIQTGSFFAPAIREAIDVLMGLMDRISDVNESFDGMLIPILLVSGLIGGLVIAVGALLPLLIPAAGGIAAMAVATKGLALAILTISAPIALVIGLIALLGIAWTKNWGDIQGKTSEAIAFITGIINTFVEGIIDLWNKHGDDVIQAVTTAFETVQTLISDYLNFIWTGLIEPILDDIIQLWEHYGGSLIDETVRTFEMLIEKYMEKLNFIVDNIIVPILEAIVAFWEAHGEKIIAYVSFLFDLIRTIIVTALDLIITTIRVVLAVIRGDWEHAWNLIANFVYRLWDRIVELAGSFKDMLVAVFGDIVEGIIEWFQDLWTRLVGSSLIPDLFSRILELAVGFATDFINWISELIDDTITAVTEWIDEWLTITTEFFANVITELTTFIGDFVADLTEFISDVITAVVDWLDEWLTTTIEFFSDMIGELSDFISDFISDVEDFLSDVFDSFVEWVDDMITAFTDWIDDMIQALDDFVDDATQLYDDFKEALIELSEEIRDRVTELFGELMDNITTFFEDLISDALVWGRDIIDNVISGVKDRASALASAFRDVATTAANAFRDAFNDIIPSSVSIPSATVNIPDILGGGSRSVGGGSISIPQLRSGGLVTQAGAVTLHKGERVIPSAQVQRSRSQTDTSSGTVNNFEVTVNANNRREGREAGKAFTRQLRSENFN